MKTETVDILESIIKKNSTKILSGILVEFPFKKQTKTFINGFISLLT